MTTVSLQSVIIRTALPPDAERDMEFGVKVDGNEIPQEVDAPSTLCNSWWFNSSLEKGRGRRVSTYSSTRLIDWLVG